MTAAGRRPSPPAPRKARAAAIPAPRRGARALPLVLVALTAYFILSSPRPLGPVFHADDFIFLLRTRAASFVSLWLPRDLPFGYYRPFSREFSFWLFQHLFGPRELPFHLTAVSLYLATLALYFTLARRLVGVASAALAVLAVAALAAWGTPLLWASGLQDLWMLAFSMACLLCVSRGRMRAATVFTGLALLSKEPAIVLPALAVTWMLAIERRGLVESLRRSAPLWVVALAWAALHPLLGGRLAHPAPGPGGPLVNPIAARMVLQAVEALANLDARPHPFLPWKAVILHALPGMLVLAAAAWFLVARRARGADEAAPERASPGRVLAFGVAWTVLGWLALLQPPLTWHAYYGLMGSMGAWVLIAGALGRVPWAAAPLVAALALLRVAQSMTPSLDLGTEFYQIRAANFMAMSRSYFTTRAPTPPPRSRIYVAEVPGSVGLIPGIAPSIVMQVWTGDTTLWTRYASQYRPRGPADSLGEDFLFTYDPKTGWRSDHILIPSASSTPVELTGYADFLASVGHFAEAATQFAHLAAMVPERWEYAFNAGSCCLRASDSVGAARWYARAASVPNAPLQVQRTAEHTRRFLPP